MRKRKPHTEITKQKMRTSHLGRKYRPMSEEGKRNISKAKTGIKHPWFAGEKHPNWKGGITPKNKLLRFTIEYKIWRKAVFERDKYICVWCGKRGGVLNAAHIKSYSKYSELRFELSNGRTLCKSCHFKTDTYGGKSRTLIKI